MATGPEHYREAERLLGQLGTDEAEQITWKLAKLQALHAVTHAILALAAATANRSGGAEFNDYGTWQVTP